MEKETLESLGLWFESYAKTFADSAGRLPMASERKRVHTHEVRAAAARIASSQRGAALSGSAALLAECGGLLHDVARFEQYKIYKTFYDGKSFDHGDAGARIIEEQKLLEGLSGREASMILKAVRFHNKPVLPPEGLDDEELCLAKVVRDADKVAILRLIADYIESGSEHWRDPAITLNMPDDGSFTESIARAAIEGRMVLHKDMRSVNDFLISLFAWPVDLNYAESAGMILETRVFERIGAHLPDCQTIDELKAKSAAHLKALAGK